MDKCCCFANYFFLNELNTSLSLTLKKATYSVLKCNIWVLKSVSVIQRELSLLCSAHEWTTQFTATGCCSIQDATVFTRGCCRVLLSLAQWSGFILLFRKSSSGWLIEKRDGTWDQVHIVAVSFLLPVFQLSSGDCSWETGHWARVGWPRTATHMLIPYLFVDFPLSLAVLLRKVEIALQWWNVEFFTSGTVVILISFPFPIM